VNGELRTPEEFATATRFVRLDDMRESVWISSDLGWHAARIAELAELGFAEIQLHQVGRNQKEFIEAFGQHVLPALGR
jgi:alkanesulfonate monooxygenase SsuD/methylene tetrahydromethanopterin reductase-like flavin-dependent oxidoreductase (luciferase family)